MAPARRDLSEAEQLRLQQLRDQSAAALDRHLEDGPGPDDPLGRLAWKAGTMRPEGEPFDEDLRQRIEVATEARFTWREISDALGKGDSPAAARRVRENQGNWNETAALLEANGSGD